MINLVIIGCGAITTVRHAPECQEAENINLKGVFDVNQARCQEVAKQFDCKAYESYDEVLNDSSVDGVIICVNNKFHCDMTVKALKHKKHVLCEKPLAVTLEEAQLMVDTAKEEGCYLMTAQNQRLGLANRKIKELLDSGEFGKVISFHTMFTHSGPEAWSVEKSNKTWFLNKKEAGLGALGDIGIHKVDLIRWLLGEEIKYVTSVIGTLDKKDAEGNPIGMEDNAFAILETENGIMGTLEASWTHYGKISNDTKLYCEKGIIEAIGEEKIIVYYKDAEKEDLVFEIQSASSKVAETFADCIIQKREPEISGEDGLQALAIVLACVESSKKHTRVEL